MSNTCIRHAYVPYISIVCTCSSWRVAGASLFQACARHVRPIPRRLSASDISIYCRGFVCFCLCLSWLFGDGGQPYTGLPWVEAVQLWGASCLGSLFSQGGLCRGDYCTRFRFSPRGTLSCCMPVCLVHPLRMHCRRYAYGCTRYRLS